MKPLHQVEFSVIDRIVIVACLRHLLTIKSARFVETQ